MKSHKSKTQLLGKFDEQNNFEFILKTIQKASEQKQ